MVMHTTYTSLQAMQMVSNLRQAVGEAATEGFCASTENVGSFAIVIDTYHKNHKMIRMIRMIKNYF